MSNPNFNDGGLGFGCRQVKFYPVDAALDGGGSSAYTGAARGIYILEGFTPSRPTRSVDRMDEVGAPNGGVDVLGVATFTCTVQLATATTAKIHLSDGFTTDSGYGNESWRVTEATDPEAQGEIRKQTITGKKIYKATSLPAAYP